MNEYLKIINEINLISDAIKTHPLNMSEAARAAGIPFNSFKRRAERLNLYNPNQGQAEARREYQSKLSWDECSTNEKRRRVLNEQNDRCEYCSLEEWQGHTLIFELDHIDGNHENNNRRNLRMLCPNCHSQTPTWRRGMKRGISDEKLINALKQNTTIMAALQSLNLKANGGTHYARARKLIQQENIKMHG